MPRRSLVDVRITVLPAKNNNYCLTIFKNTVQNAAKFALIKQGISRKGYLIVFEVPVSRPGWHHTT